MRADFILRSGKYAGKTYEWVLETDPSYLVWITDNRPEMLREQKEPKKEVKVTNVKEETKSFVLQPNEDFYNEPPDAQCIPYMLDHADEYQEQLLAFSTAYKTQYRLIKKEHEREKISRVQQNSSDLEI